MCISVCLFNKFVMIPLTISENDLSKNLCYWDETECWVDAQIPQEQHFAQVANIMLTSFLIQYKILYE